MNGRIVKSDSLEFMKKQEDCSADIIYCDPPYALGSEIIIRKDGKPDYKKAVDFMNKWEQPNGDFWEAWFKEAFRTLKYGGRVIMFGMDRQLMLNKYYACNAGFEEQQSLYWYFISNFPKATDLSKMIDRNAGAEREVIGEGVGSNLKKQNELNKEQGYRPNNYYEDNEGKFDITKANSNLAKKYEGYKYSISPLKQTNETIMIFQKPYKTGSCLHDTLAHENGDRECLCGALNIDGGRVPTNETDDKRLNGNGSWRTDKAAKNVYEGGYEGKDIVSSSLGRYPAQTFIDEEAAKRLDRQSGEKQSVKSKIIHNAYGDKFKFGGGISTPDNQYEDTGGCSKILHKCKFDEEEHDIYFYFPKVSKAERNGGLNELEDSLMARSGGAQQAERNGETEYLQSHIGMNRISTVKNNHPTLKPIALNKRILSLFKTPNEQKILYPFAGTFSEVIGGYLAGFTNYEGCELEEAWITIGEARFSYWINREKKEVAGNEDQFNLFIKTEAA
jgi:site-specific DNA-methyltransferase (adenine-specific)